MFDKSADLYDLFYDFKDYAAEADAIREIVRSRRSEARTLLDVACGTGRHLEQLRASFDAEGVDLDAGLLHVAAARLAGVPLHRGDMRVVDLGRTFDVVTCLFSSIGYMQTTEDLSLAAATLVRHLAPGGVLIVEPWLTPSAFDPDHVAGMSVVEAPGLRAVRTNSSRVEDGRSIMDFHYLVARAGSVEHLVETHVLGLFTDDEYRAAFEHAGLEVEHDPDGLTGRGLWIGRMPG